MNGSELLDVYDGAGRHLGVADRRRVHAEGLWHRVFHILVVAGRRGGGVNAVLQRRALGKQSFGGLVDLTATGHLLAGEEPHEGLRELSEEVGIELDPRSLVFLGVQRVVDLTPEGTNREFCHLYVAHDDRPLDAYCPDPAEVSAVLSIPLAAALELMRGLRSEASVVSLAAGAPGEDPSRLTSRVVLRREDFVPEPVGGGPPWSRWCEVFELAARALDVVSGR